MRPVAALALLSCALVEPAWAACDSPTSARELTDAGTAFFAAWDQMDASAVAAAVADADRAVACIDEPLAAPDIVKLFQLHGLSASLAEDNKAARDAFRAAVAILPAYSLPSTVAAPGDPWYEMYEALKSMPADATTPLAAPEHGWIQVDGARSDSAPQGRPWVFQQFDATGAVVQTAVVPTGGKAPEYVAVAAAPPEPAPAPQPAPVQARAATSRGLAIGGGVAAVVGAAGLGGAAALKSMYRNETNPAAADDLIGPNIALGALGWAGVATSAGLTTSALVVGRW